METFLTAPELAQRLRVRVTTIYTWTSRRQIPFQKVGGALRFSLPAVERWLREQSWGLPPPEGSVASDPSRDSPPRTVAKPPSPNARGQGRRELP